MNLYELAPFHAVRRLAAVAVILGIVCVPALGCDSNSEDQPDHSLRADVAAIRSIHGDPDAIGTLDATAPPSDLSAYGKPEYRPASAR